MIRSTVFTLVTALAATLVLSGCGGVRQSLGLVRTSPDEFAVVAKPPLVLPPDFGLRPPVPGAPPISQQADATTQAANALAAAAPTQAQAQRQATPTTWANLSPAENALLGAAGVAATDPGIRQRVDFEAAQIAEKGRGFTERLLGFQRPGETLNAAAEAERLRAAGQTVTGPQPTARRNGQGLLR